MDIISDGIWWQIPDTRPSKAACLIFRSRIETEEFNDALAVFVGRAFLVLFPFLDGTAADAKSQHSSQLRHGKLQVDSFLSKVLAYRFGVGRIATSTSVI